MRAGEDVRAAIEHDLRTPLTVIAGYAELLRVRDDDRTRAEAADALLEAADRLSGLVTELLDMLPVPSPPPAAGRPRVGRRCILIVDDDAALRSLIRSTLSPDEFDILEASDGQEAIRLIGARRPDLVLLDWHMPGAGGGEVLDRLARDHSGVAAIIISAQPRERVSAPGAVFLSKPFSPTELLRLIDELLAA